MTVHYPHSPGSEDYSVGGSSFLSLTGLSPNQRQVLVEMAAQFAVAKHTPRPIEKPPGDYYIRGRRDLQLVHDAISWYSGEVKKQYQGSSIRMVDGILLEATAQLDEMAEQIRIIIDALGEENE